MESILPLIRIVDLKKSYGEKEILKGINLDIFPGQVIGYIGPNGAGKSTTVKILTGLIEDFTGTVEINSKRSTCSKSIIGICSRKRRII